MFPAPQLVVDGREGRVIPLANPCWRWSSCPAELQVFGRCGHWSQIEHAAAFNRLVLEFLTRDRPRLPRGARRGRLTTWRRRDGTS